MSEKKITKKEMFNLIKGVAGLTDEMKAFIDHEIELLDKKNASKKPTKVQVANEGMKADIMAVFTSVAPGTKMTVSEIIKANPVLIGQTTQKITALLNLLKGEEKVDKITEKRVTYYFAV